MLCDQNVPIGVLRFLKSHDCHTCFSLGWDRLSNGELLREAAKYGFTVFLTCDRNLPKQQSVKGMGLAVVVLGTNRWSILQQESRRITDAVERARAGEMVEVEFPKRIPSPSPEPS